MALDEESSSSCLRLGPCLPRLQNSIFGWDPTDKHMRRLWLQGCGPVSGLAINASFSYSGEVGQVAVRDFQRGLSFSAPQVCRYCSPSLHSHKTCAAHHDPWNPQSPSILPRTPAPSQGQANGLWQAPHKVRRHQHESLRPTLELKVMKGWLCWNPTEHTARVTRGFCYQRLV